MGLVWTPALAIGIPEIDQQHQELFYRLSKLLEGIVSGDRAQVSGLIEFLGLGKNSGVAGLAKALRFRLYATVNEDEIIIGEDGKTLEYRVKTCRVQSTRRRKGLTDFPCKTVGIVEYGYFARTIDERFETEAISCPPDIVNHDYYCIWRFRLKD